MRNLTGEQDAKAGGTGRTAEDSAGSNLESFTADRVLRHAVEHHGEGLAVACSFQKEESVLLHLLSQIGGKWRAFAIDTGVLFPETLATWREFEQRWGIRIEPFDASSPTGEPWTGGEHCCSTTGIKVAALERALEGATAWVAGVRREQSPTRADSRKLEDDTGRGIAKYNPLADWSERDVWAYVAEHELPYNPLHDAGYASIGCAPCTLPGAGREGRWAGSEKTECGLHVVEG